MGNQCDADAVDGEGEGGFRGGGIGEFFFFGPSFTSTCVTGSISATSCLRNPPLTGHSPNAPGRSLHLSALGRTLGSLSKLPCSGHV